MNQWDDATYELISAYLDGELTNDERARVEQLLGAEAEHQQVLLEMQSLRSDLQQLPDYELGAAFAGRVLQAARDVAGAEPVILDRLARQSASARWSSRVRWAVSGLAAAAVLLLVATAVYRFNPTGTTPQQSFQLAQVAPGQDEGIGNRPAEDLAQETSPAASLAQEQMRSNDLTGDKPDPLGGRVCKSLAANAPVIRTPDSPGDALAQEDAAQRSVAAAAMAASGTPQAADAAQVPAISRPDAEATVVQDGAIADDGSRKIDISPGQTAQKVLLVFDVELSRAAWESGAFDQLLREEGVAFDSNIKAEEHLEQALLKSRYFEPAEGEQATVRGDREFTIVYVVSQGSAIDRVWQRMEGDREDYSNVSLDLALHPEDATVFQQLQQLGNMAAIQAQGESSTAVGVARKLDVAPSWNGVPSTRAADAGGFAGLLAGVGNALEDTPSESLQPGALPPAMTNPGQRVGATGALPTEVLPTEAIFVLRIASGSTGAGK